MHTDNNTIPTGKWYSLYNPPLRAKQAALANAKTTMTVKLTSPVAEPPLPLPPITKPIDKLIMELAQERKKYNYLYVDYDFYQ